MNDLFPKSQDEWNERYISDAPMDQKFTVINYCSDCGRKVYDLSQAGFFTCTCQPRYARLPKEKVETLYQCSLCEEESEDEECNCYKK